MKPGSTCCGGSAPSFESILKTQWLFSLATLLLLSACGGSSTPPAPPNLQLSAASISFGVQPVGTESAAQTENLLNTGGSVLDIGSIAITGDNAADFNHSGTCGSTLGPGASCAISVTFAPSQIGQRSASIVIADNALPSAQTLSLDGLGATSGPNVTLSPDNLDFGSQKVGTTSGALTISLSNYGTTTLEIASVSADNAAFAETDDCNTLASGTNCSVNITFTPGDVGTVTSTLSILDNAPDSPQIVSLKGGGSTGQCAGVGRPCYEASPCCAGLVCVFAGNRAYCQPGASSRARAVLRERF